MGRIDPWESLSRQARAQSIRDQSGDRSGLSPTATGILFVGHAYSSERASKLLEDMYLSES
jgi:hypothetical protein